MATSNIWTSLDGGPFDQGLDIEQTSPLGGSYAGPISFNTINVVDQGGITITGSGDDAFGLSNTNLVGFRVNYSTPDGGVRGSGLVALAVTSTHSGSFYGLGGSAYTNTHSNALLWGNIGIGKVGPTGIASVLIGLEGEVAVATGGTVNSRAAVGANSQGPVAGAFIDTAYLVTAGPDLGSAPFKNMFTISSTLYSSPPQPPIAPTGSIFVADAPITIANVFNSSNWTLTGKFADFPTFGINGATGQAAFGLPVGGIPSNYGLWVGGTSKGNAGIGVSINGVTGSSFLELQNSFITSQVDVFAHEPGRTTVRYGVTLGNYTEMSAFSGNGLIVGTNNSAPLMLGTNNVNRMQITAGGLVNIGPNVTPAANLTVNNNTVAPSSVANASLQMNGADGVSSLALMDSYGTGQFGSFVFRSARGSGSAFTANLSGDPLGQFGFFGASAANTFVNTGGANGGAIIGANATEAWSATNQGTRLKFFVTPNGTAAVNLAMVLQNTGQLTVGASTAIPAGGTAGTGLALSSTANFGIFFGSGVPTLSAAQGSLYLRSDGSSTITRMYVNTNGTTGWTNVVTAT